jgi:hypothetical protein
METNEVDLDPVQNSADFWAKIPDRQLNGQMGYNSFGSTQVEKSDVRSCNLAVRSSYMGEIL